MRHGKILGAVAIWGWITTTSATAQFASDRVPPPTAQPPVVRPTPAPSPAPTPTRSAPTTSPASLPSFPSSAPIPTPRNPAQTVSYATPASQPAQSAQSVPAVQNHPLAVQPKHGPWMILVKSYTGEGSKELAEQLAEEIRRNCRSSAWLFEWGAEERREEELRLQEVRKRYRQEYEPFLQLKAELKAKAEAEGREFIDEPLKIPVPRIAVREQWAVLIGGFPDMESARAALDTVRTWPTPTNKALLDQSFILKPKADGSMAREATAVNPYLQAFVVPNPAVSRSETDQAVIRDPAIRKLNEGEPYSLLQARKPWTLLVKRYAVPSRVVGNEQPTNVIARMFSSDKSAELLEDIAKQARNLAATLRDPKQPRQFESFVLHDRTESMVTVGQFDGPDDPALVQTYLALSQLTYDVYDKDPKDPTARKIDSRRIFNAITPMRVPKLVE